METSTRRLDGRPKPIQLAALAALCLFAPLAGCTRHADGVGDTSPANETVDGTAPDAVDAAAEPVDSVDDADPLRVYDPSVGEAELLALALELAPGMHVADVGAGDGDWTLELATRVGPDGLVWATEVDEDLVDEIRDRADDEDLDNVRVVQGDQESIGLGAACCDAILLRLVYHHFTDPAPMRADLRRALRPGGRLAIIDIAPQEDWRDLPGVPDRGGHGIPATVLVNEMTADGWRVVERVDAWNGDQDRFAVIFRRASD